MFDAFISGMVSRVGEGVEIIFFLAGTAPEIAEYRPVREGISG